MDVSNLVLALIGVVLTAYAVIRGFAGRKPPESIDNSGEYDTVHDNLDQQLFEEVEQIEHETPAKIEDLTGRPDATSDYVQSIIDGLRARRKDD